MTLDPVSVAWIVALLPSIVATFAVFAYWRYLREADELSRAIEVKALALAVTVGFVVWPAIELLEASGVPLKVGSSLTALVMIVSYSIATLEVEMGGEILAGPLVLALAFLGADMAESRRRGSSLRPSFIATILAGTILVSSLIVTLRDPRLLLTFIPVIGITLWFPLFLRRSPRTMQAHARRIGTTCVND